MHCRLNCQKAAMRSLRLARNSSIHDHERLVYEGWILYDTGHRDEALEKAEQSLRLQRSFEAFFLKAYALGDTSLDIESALSVVQLLEQANSCASDNLRKGQVRIIHHRFSFCTTFILCANSSLTFSRHITIWGAYMWIVICWMRQLNATA